MGLMGKIEFEKAKGWYIKAVKGGIVDAMLSLAGIYESEGELSAAKKLYSKVIEIYTKYRV